MKDYAVQYYEVIGGLTGKCGGKLTYLFVIVSLAIASVIQLIASARRVLPCDKSNKSTQD